MNYVFLKKICLKSLFFVYLSAGSIAVSMDRGQFAEDLSFQKDGKDNIFEAICGNSVERVSEIVKAKKIDFNEEYKDYVPFFGGRFLISSRHTVLYLAFYRGNADIVELLLKNGAIEFINQETSERKALLRIILDEGYVDIFKLLLKYNVNIDKEFVESRVESSCKSSDKEIFKLLKTDMNVFEAIQSNNIERLRELIAKRAFNVNDLKDSDCRENVLTYALEYGQSWEVIKLLLPLCDEKALNHVNIWGSNPLSRIVELVDVTYEDVEFILKKGAWKSINHQYFVGGDKLPETALSNACKRGDINIVKLLLKFGEAVDQKSLDVAKKNLAIGKYLELAMEFDINNICCKVFESFKNEGLRRELAVFLEELKNSRRANFALPMSHKSRNKYLDCRVITED